MSKEIHQVSICVSVHVVLVCVCVCVEYLLFCQALLSPQLSEKIPVVLIRRFHSQSLKMESENSFRLWIVSHQVWSEIYLQNEENEGLRYEMINYLQRLTYPSIVCIYIIHYILYNTFLQLAFSTADNINMIYKGSGLRYFIIFHHTDQLNGIMNDFLRPLVNKFRPNFAFVTVDR